MKKLITILAAFLVINAAYAQPTNFSIKLGSGADTMTNTTALTLSMATGYTMPMFFKSQAAIILNTVLVSGHDTGYVIVQRSFDNSHWGSCAGDTTNMVYNTSYNYAIYITNLAPFVYYRVVLKGTAATAKLAVGYAYLYGQNEEYIYKNQ